VRGWTTIDVSIGGREEGVVWGDWVNIDISIGGKEGGVCCVGGTRPPLM